MVPKTSPTRTAASINDAEAVCDCPGNEEGAVTRSRDRDEYFTCSRCARLQHNACYVKDLTERTGPEHYLCNLCTATEIEELEQRIKEVAERVARKQEEFKALIMQMLWRHYCHLPDGNATRVVKDQTKMKFEGGILVPEQSAPEGWVKVVQKNLDDLMEACGKKMTDFAIRPEYHSEEMNERVLKPMREIANDLIHRGSYKGNRGKLGVLVEILGLASKGTVWKR